MWDAELLEKCLRYFLKHGVADLSLRPLAAATGTSARMLVHHFGSKEELVAVVMKEVRGKFQSILETGVRCLKDDGANIMMDFWRVATSRENLPYLRLLLEVQVLAIQNRRGYRKYLVSTSDSWLEIVASALPPGPKRVAFATLCTAVIDGLLLELLSTGDQDRTFRALKFFTDRFAKRVRGKSGAHR